MDKKQYTISIKVTDKEKKQIEANAYYFGKTVSQYLRENAVSRTSNNELATFRNSLMREVHEAFEKLIEKNKEQQLRHEEVIKRILFQELAGG
ncbi:MAG: hypothetical protein FH747_04625 [Stenotrophomonas sp.]|uniref:plasmid mobilization protein n=1 Tax=Stenotrophomonas sp. TaxID=69392 RepID=UPI0013536243|nr:hypothetical protein [Stenotrophomonas sp.]MTI72930.1 hypothetical protein [Stenotrophomonas sp.]